jgi:prevent-host-death family protein
MKTVNMHEAKTTLSKLVEMVEAGEEVMIARRGKPVAQLVVPAARIKRGDVLPDRSKTRVAGLLQGLIAVPQSAIDPLTNEDLGFFEDAPNWPELES